MVVLKREVFSKRGQALYVGGWHGPEAGRLTSDRHSLAGEQEVHHIRFLGAGRCV